MLDVPRVLAQYVSRLLRVERHHRGTRRDTRALSCFEQAVLGLRWFREGREITALARDHGISRATGYRYVAEVIAVLAGQAPDLHDALHKARADGASYVVLDGKIFATDRLGEKATSVKGKRIHAWYSGKTRRTGGNIQAVMAPDGFPLWVSDVVPGSVHDLTAAREQVLGALSWAASHLDLPTLADFGYQGAGIGIHTPLRQPPGGGELDTDSHTYNTLLRGLRCLGERGFALLTQRWRTLRHTTTSPRQLTNIIKAALVLTHHEHHHTQPH